MNLILDFLNHKMSIWHTMENSVVIGQNLLNWGMVKVLVTLEYAKLEDLCVLD